MTRVFALTTRTFDWFEQFGFVEAGLASLPPGGAKPYNHLRKSRIFVLDLRDRQTINFAFFLVFGWYVLLVAYRRLTDAVMSR